MHIQKLLKFYQFVLLRGNEIMIDGMTDKPKSSIAPLFQSGAIKMTGKTFILVLTLCGWDQQRVYNVVILRQFFFFLSPQFGASRVCVS